MLHDALPAGRLSATYVGLLTTGRTFKTFKAFVCKPLVASLAAATTGASGLAQHPSTIRTSCNGNPSAGLAGHE